MLIRSAGLWAYDYRCGQSDDFGRSNATSLGATVVSLHFLSLIWNRPNRMLTEGGYLADPLTLAQRLMERLQVDLADDNDGAAEM